MSLPGQYSVLAVLSRSGRKVDNWELYPSALQELGRVCRPSTARAILLTHDNKALSRVSVSRESAASCSACEVVCVKSVCQLCMRS